MKSFEVLEDKGGRITLVVFSDDGIVEYIHSGYKNNYGQLMEDIEALEKGENQIEDNYCRLKLIADNGGVYLGRMGNDARNAFINPKDNIAKKELSDVLDKLAEWRKKYGVGYVTMAILADGKAKAYDFDNRKSKYEVFKIYK